MSKLLNQYNLKPVMGVIPNNKDEELLKYPKRENFWQIIQNWISNDWKYSHAWMQSFV